MGWITKSLKWIFLLYISSLISTMLPLPPVISPADPAFIALVTDVRANRILEMIRSLQLSMIILILMMTVFDTVNGYITYLLTGKIRNFIVRFEHKRRKMRQNMNSKYGGYINTVKMYTIAPFTSNLFLFGKVHKMLYKDQYYSHLEGDEDLKQSSSLMNRWGAPFIVLFSASPLPFTLGIYAVSVANYKNHGKFVLAIFIGRLIKYAAIAYALDYGLKLLDFLIEVFTWQDWLTLGVVGFGSLWFIASLILHKIQLNKTYRMFNLDEDKQIRKKLRWELREKKTREKLEREEERRMKKKYRNLLKFHEYE